MSVPLGLPLQIWWVLAYRSFHSADSDIRHHAAAASVMIKSRLMVAAAVSPAAAALIT